MTKRTFTVGSTQPGEEGPEFELQGTDRMGKPLEPISFRCLPEVQGIALTNVVQAANNGVAFVAPEIEQFIHACLLPEEEARFDELINGKDVIVSIDQLGEIMMWLTEEYSNRPFPQPKGSSPGPLPMPDISTATSGQPVDRTPGSFQ